MGESDSQYRRLTDAVAAVIERACGAPPKLCVAFSGGLDSTVLLHVLVHLYGAAQVRAVHINHGLQPDAAAWARHCCKAATNLGVACVVRQVTVAQSTGTSVEAQARAARYAALSAELRPDEVLVTAHHAQDQLETVLLAVLRGSGVHGIAAMPEYAELHGCRILRPLLTVTRDSLAAVAAVAGVDWLDDPSNDDERFDRNYLRHRVVPALEARWPGAALAAGRTARHSAGAAMVLDEVAVRDLGAGLRGNCLALAVLAPLQPARRANLVRCVCGRLGLPVPTEAQLQELLDVLTAARDDATPLLAWPGVRVRRYRDVAWFFPATADPGDPAVEAAQLYPWDGCGELELGPVRGRLRLLGRNGRELTPAAAGRQFEVRFRTGGEQLRPAPDAATRDLKKLLQEAGVVPWMRKHIPLLYLDDRLLAAGDRWLNADHPACGGGVPFTVEWRAHAPLANPF